MSKISTEVLHEIPIEDLSHLRDLFKKKWPKYALPYGVVNTAIQWHEKRPNDKYVTFYCPDGKWNDGTFVAIYNVSLDDIYIFTLEKSCKRLQHALTKTKLINWSKVLTFPAVHRKHEAAFRAALKAINRPIPPDYLTVYYWLSKERALEFKIDIPDDVYVAPLTYNHADVIDATWFWSGGNSIEYVRKLIEINGGMGLFSKLDDSLCSWISRNNYGSLSLLHTRTEHTRKGYAACLIKIYSKKIAEEESDVTAFIINENEPSKKLFILLGFQEVTNVYWFVDGVKRSYKL